MKKKLPLVSIIIPAYNGAKFLKSSVQSVIDQNYPKIELLVFDDGSTDNTVDILKSYENSFYWESHENIGQSATLNKGWEMAKGDFLSYLSVDDLLEPNAVSLSVDYLLEHLDIIMTYGDYFLIDNDSNLIKEVKTPEFNYSDLLSKIIMQPGPGVFFRREGFLKIGGWNTKLRQMPDFDYWLRLGQLGDFARIPLLLASFRVHENSQTYTESSVEKSEECLQIMDEYFSKGKLPRHLRSLKCSAYSSAHIVAARLHIRAGRYMMAIRHLFKAFDRDKRTLFSLRALRLISNATIYCVKRRLSFE